MAVPEAPDHASIITRHVTDPVLSQLGGGFCRIPREAQTHLGI
jgi:hypothetical protein